MSEQAEPSKLEQGDNDSWSPPVNDIDKLEQYMEAEFMTSAAYEKIKNISLELRKCSDNLMSHYEWLQTVVKRNTGVAGGDCEDQFARFLGRFLPSGFGVTTRGIIFLESGELSPEIDLILTKDLPEDLFKNYIPHEYVVAAFEVKSTLENRYMEKIATTAALLRPVPREGKPREVLFGRIIYGVLALSSNFKGSRKPTRLKTLDDNDQELHAFRKSLEQWRPAHPSQTIDLVLVADAFSLAATKTINYSEKYPNDMPDVNVSYSYNISSGSDRKSASNLARLVSAPPRDQILGAFIYKLSLMLFHENIFTWRHPQAFFEFRSNMAVGCYEWDIESLGEDFKSEWINHPGGCDYDWTSTHPVE